jgi:phosphoribosylformylglycinamidine synthase
LEAHVLGTLDASGLMRIRHKGEVVAEIPADQISENSPVYHREARRPAYMDTIPQASSWAPPDGWNAGDELVAFLASANIASKRWIYEQYDHMVQTQTATLPGDNAGVLAVHGSRHSLALAADGNGLYCYLDPYEGGKLAVAEAARNVACTGARPLAVTNCLNFGSPLKPEIFFQLAEAVRGIGDACRELGTPVTGGNVSLYNENPSGAIWPTPIIGMVGKIEAPTRPVGAGFRRPGAQVLLLGTSAGHLGGSEYLRWKTGQIHGPCPECSLLREHALIQVLVAAANAGLLDSAQDCGVGGLGVALAESLLLAKPGIGVAVEIVAVPVGAAGLCRALFSEVSGRALVSVAPDKEPALLKLCTKHGVEVAFLGATNSDGSLRIEAGDDLHALSVSDLADAYYSTSSIFPDMAADVPLH